jgi:hypothetical protein
VIIVSSNSDASAPAPVARGWWGLFAGLGAVLALSYAKGFNPALQTWGEFYWYVDYSEGFLRRGLIGTLVAPVRLLVADSVAFNRIVLGAYHVVAIALLLGMCAVMTASIARLRRHRIAACFGALIFVASPLVSNLGFLTGYVDPLLMAAALAGAVLVRRGRYLLAGAIGVLAVLCNEGAVFLWIPVAFLAVFGRGVTEWQDFAARLACAMAPPVAVAMIPLFESPGVAARVISGVPHFSLAVGQRLIELHYGQTMPGQVAAQMAALQAHPFHFLISMLVTLPATASIAVCVVLIDGDASPSRRVFRWRRMRWLAIFAFCFAPFLMLFFAWDLSRLMAWTNFSAGLLLLLSLSSAAGVKS